VSRNPTTATPSKTSPSLAAGSTRSAEVALLQQGDTRDGASGYLSAAEVRVIAPNLKPRQTGVSSTVFRLVPLQRALGCAIASVGWLPPGEFPRLRVADLLGALLLTGRATRRVWHARRNIEMLSGLVLHALGANLGLVFTSAAQRRHTGYTRWLMRRMDRIVATSTTSASFLDLPATVLSHGVDTELFTPPADKRAAKLSAGLAPDALYLGSFGAIRHAKGTDVFVDALLRALPVDPRWQALVVGAAPGKGQQLLEQMRGRVGAAGLAERIHFLGHVPDARPILAAVDICVAPSRKEGFGLTPLEAMSSGIAAVTTDAGSYPEMIVEGETGHVVPAGDAASLADAMLGLMRDDALRQAMGQRGREHVLSNYRLESEASALIAIYDEVLRTGQFATD